MLMISSGQKAPEFELKDKDGRTHKLSGTNAKYTIVYFYPKDDTPGCTTEAKNFTKDLEKFNELNVTIFGISGGDEKSKQDFCAKYGLNVLLLSDSDFSTAKAYEAYGQKVSATGQTSIGILRKTFVLDNNKYILKIYENVQPNVHSEEVLDFIRGFDSGNLRKAEYSVYPLLISRWSPRSMTNDISRNEIMSLFEAAKWAPSSFNNQPWRFLYAVQGTEYWSTFFELLNDSNKVWAKNAAVLIVILSRKTFEHNGKPSKTHSFDTGLAVENLVLQGYSMGFAMHMLEGFDYNKARAELNVPEEFDIEAMIAAGRKRRKEDLPENLQAKEYPKDRKKVSDIAFEGKFN